MTHGGIRTEAVAHLRGLLYHCGTLVGKTWIKSDQLKTPLALRNKIVSNIKICL